MCLCFSVGVIVTLVVAGLVASFVDGCFGFWLCGDNSVGSGIVGD